MKVLLTGAAGTVGHHLITELLKKDYEVTAIEIKNKKTLKRLKPYFGKINIIWGSITDKNLINSLIENKDVVIHLAGLLPPFAEEHRELTKQVNYFGTENIVKAIEEKNSKCFLMFASSISVYGDRLKNSNITIKDKLQVDENEYYALIKKETEDMIRNSKINYTIYRLSAIMDLPKTDPLMFNMPLETKIEIVSARDTARAFANGIEHLDKLNKNTYNLGGGEECRTTYKDFLKGVFNIYGLKYSKLDQSAFADKGFHCGNYLDGDVLNDIVDFRQDTLETYYNYLKEHVSNAKRNATRIFSDVIISKLNKTSKPKQAVKNNDEKLIARFFNKGKQLIGKKQKKEKKKNVK